MLVSPDDAELWSKVKRRVTYDSRGNIVCDEECHEGVPRAIAMRRLPKDCPWNVVCRFYDELGEDTMRLKELKEKFCSQEAD